LRAKDLASRLGVQNSDRRDFKDFLAVLVHDGELRLRKGRWYRLGDPKEIVPERHTKPGSDAARSREELFQGIFADAELPIRFGAKVNEALCAIPESVDKIPPGFEDLRSIPFVTIDPVEAKDFDDAVAAEALPDGGIRLFVGIAHVSHYVILNGALDREAYKRGNSVYYPGGVIPMLPHELSSGICSLKPEQDRLVLAAIMDYSAMGKCVGTRFVQGIMHSRRRLTYDEAQEILDGRGELSDELAPSFAAMERLYRKLAQLSAERGALDLDIPEAEIRLDAEGRIASLRRSPRNDSHRLIEEFMIAANCAVAEHLHKLGWSCLYRIHDVPDPEKLMNYGNLARELGYPFPDEEGGVSGRELNRFLRSLEGQDDRDYLHILLLRSLKQALYSPLTMGHFGLGLVHYAHFTSPIRRYADLVVHRILVGAITGKKAKQALAGFTDLDLVGEQCSMTERRAMDVERKADAICQAEFMQDKLGEEYEAQVSGVVAFGLFVQIGEPFVEGLIHISRLMDDYYLFFEEEHALIGRSTRRRFRLGDRVKVRLSYVDVPHGRIDFDLVDMEGVGPKARRPPRDRAGKSPRKDTARRRPEAKGRTSGKKGPGKGRKSKPHGSARPAAKSGRTSRGKNTKHR